MRCFPVLRKETEGQHTSDSTAWSSWLSEERLQGRGASHGEQGWLHPQGGLLLTAGGHLGCLVITLVAIQKLASV